MKKIKTYLSNLPKVTKWIIGLNFLIYLIFLMTKVFTGVNLQDYFAAYPTYSENFNPITIFTSMFVHAMFPSHVLTNMVLMLVFAPFVENKIGSKNFLFTYLFIGFFGYLSVNYSYYVNQYNITNSIQNVGLNIEDIKIDNGVVSEDYLSSLNKNQSNVVSNYNYVISKTYGASAALYGMFILYLLFNIFNIKKVIFTLIALYFIGYTVFVVFNNQPILNGGEFAHFGGILGGIISFLTYKTKKGIS